ncbi:uncharacterized protein LOC110030591 [Phalaenopsis equestris]|uniref:uncharacterized protein LOC110030591 n=1 Tax=Phalaenopsis equestris TaxID=78828 RepID=UPI0009E2BE97|nr:uncharacterized protein LOC110030591 [Phalaenopsis equestris]
MAVSFTRLSYWLWGTKDGNESTNSALNSSSDFPSGFREHDSVRFPCVNGTEMKSSSRRIKKKWRSREERRVRIDREFDVVIVPSDGGCLSGSETDDSDWSIGWMEPHAPEFQGSDGETDGSFAVLVPCYRRGRSEIRESLKGQALVALTEHYGFSSDGSELIERWLSSLQDM